MKRGISISLISIGIILLSLGAITKSEMTPVGQMDCGCGGGTECVTKNASISIGMIYAISGSISLLAGAVLTIVRLKPGCQTA